MAKKAGFDAWVIVAKLAEIIWKGFLLFCRIIKRFAKALAQEIATSLVNKRTQLIARSRYGILEKITVGTLIIVCEEIAR